jgi:hypothetical protein
MKWRLPLLFRCSLLSLALHFSLFEQLKGGSEKDVTMLFPQTKGDALCPSKTAAQPSSKAISLEAAASELGLQSPILESVPYLYSEFQLIESYGMITDFLLDIR